MNTYMRFFDKIFTFFKSIGESFYDSVIYDNRYEFILKGLFHTIIIAFFAVIIGIIIGIIIALIRHNYDTNGKMRIGNKVSTIYVNIIRGTPVLLQLMIIYYVIFKSVNVNIVIVGILAFGLNSAAYVSEIIRSGLISVDKGQMEAGLALGLSYGKVMRYIILPQAIRNILPALGNEFITLLKETSAGAYMPVRNPLRSGPVPKKSRDFPMPDFQYMHLFPESLSVESLSSEYSTETAAAFETG